MRDIGKYFNLITFAGLAMILPSTIYIILIFTCIVIPGFSENNLLLKFSRPVIFIQVTSYLSILICFIDIIAINASRTNSAMEINRIYRKSLLDVTVIFLNASYMLFIFLFTELQKLGNIPVGRN